MERHDKALEELIKARKYEKEGDKKEKIAMLREKLAYANVDIRETNKVLQLLRTHLSENMECQPMIDDYYHPSDEMISYQRMAVGGMGAAVGLITSKILLVYSIGMSEDLYFITEFFSLGYDQNDIIKFRDVEEKVSSREKEKEKGWKFTVLWFDV